jgi:hypothetical protein
LQPYPCIVSVSDELLQAVQDTLDREGEETDRVRRFLLLVWTRATLDAWRRGVLSTDEAVAWLLVWRTRPS